MTETRLVCSKCGRSEERDQALAEGWLCAQRVGAPEGYLVIRCPAHISGWARRLAGLPQQNRSKRVQDNLDRGLWTEYGGSCIASVGIGGEGDYVIEYNLTDARKHGVAPRSFATIDALIAAMREVEPDLRKWRLVEGV